MDLNTIWFLLLGVLFAGYAFLDGFDLGVGALLLSARTDEKRRIFLNAIGPVWDGNEVWLVTGGGALFAAFPHVYATLTSGFYLAVMLLLASLIFRSIAIEFRGKEPMNWWRRLWDVSFSVSSILIALLLGIAIGNLAKGIPIGPDKEFLGTFFSLLNPFAIVVGVTTVSMFMLHGALYLLIKTQGPLYGEVRQTLRSCLIFFLLCYMTLVFMTVIYAPHILTKLLANPILLLIPILKIILLANIPREIKAGRNFRAFLHSSFIILGFIVVFGISVFPNMVLSFPNPENSLTIYNAASSPKTLKIMLNIALLGMPFVIAYISFIYWVFRGKVKMDKTSY